jgi:hypothetical protein
MPVSPPQWQMPHPKADRRHCSLEGKHNTKPAGLGLSFKPQGMLKHPFKCISAEDSGLNIYSTFPTHFRKTKTFIV